MSKRPPAWLLPNLLSLDAPLVAVVWMWLLAQAMRVQYIETVFYVVLAAAVWCVYVIDRIGDVKKGKHPIEGEMPWRHRFHWKSRGVLSCGVGLVVLYCLYAAFYVLPRDLLAVGIVGGFLVLCYAFVARFDKSDVAYAKNFVAGMTFAFGVAAPVVTASAPLPFVLSDVLEPLAKASGVGYLEAVFIAIARFALMVLGALQLILLSTHVLLFGLLCVMNINAIDLWERSRRSDDPEVKQESEMSLSMGLFALVVGTVIALAFVADDYSAPLCYAVMASAGLLHIINRIRAKFSVDALRVMADLALIIPVPLAAWFT